MKIKKKLLISYVLLAIIPLLLILGVFLNIFLSTMLDSLEEYATNLSDSILGRIDSMVDETDRMLNNIYNVADFEKHIRSSSELTQDTEDYPYQLLQADLSLKNDLSYLVNERSNIEDIIVIDKAGNNFYIGSNIFRYQQDYREEEFYKEAEKIAGKRYIFTKGCNKLFNEKDKPYFAIAKIIKSRKDMENIGMIVVTISPEQIEKTYESYLEDGKQRCIILNSAGDVLMDSAPEQESVQELYLESKNVSRIEYMNQDYLVNKVTSKNTGIQIIWLSPYRFLSQKTYELIYYVVIIAIILIMICSIVSLIVSSSISKPIMNLEKMTKEISKGDFEGKYNIKDKSEIGRLYHSFIDMRDRINDLLLKEKRGRIEFLANQINPHFLYNSLDSAYMSAIANDDMETSDIIGQINILLKMVVRESSFISLQKELEIVNAYIEIQKMRYPKKFDYKVEVSEELKHIIVPKMILQPIVENAIIHGILELDEKGSILIMADMEGSILHVCVSNGPGKKSEEEINAINDYIRNHDVYESKHIGMQNIYERLNLNYSKGVRLYICNSEQIDAVEVNIYIDTSCKG